MSSVIVGVDLVPIKPIRGVTTLTEDITTEKCRSALKKASRHPPPSRPPRRGYCPGAGPALSVASTRPG